MKQSNETKSVKIFRGSMWEAQMVKNLLENEGIDSFLEDEITATLNLPWQSPGGVGLVTLVIADHNFDQARSIVQDYEHNRKENQA